MTTDSRASLTVLFAAADRRRHDPAPVSEADAATVEYADRVDPLAARIRPSGTGRATRPTARLAGGRR